MLKSLEDMVSMPTLTSLDEAAQNVGLSPERLKDLCDSQYAPHYFIENEGPFFRKTELKTWVKDNLLSARGGIPLPQTTTVIETTEAHDRPRRPNQLASIDGLYSMPKPAAVPAVYFLCHEGKVVYVGQSVCVANRVGTHVAEGAKQFDTIWFLPVPKDELVAVEDAFIATLKPKYNGPGKKWLAGGTVEKQIARFGSNEDHSTPS